MIGDVNDRNLVVAKSGITRLIDCDSIQIQAAGETFFCDVGVPTHTAPELQGTDLATTLRT
ncbi:hypothetical protein OFN42_34805, partial [Escherichia coli]|nr:hypothetical protein [Escherichia coli]